MQSRSEKRFGKEQPNLFTTRIHHVFSACHFIFSQTLYKLSFLICTRYYIMLKVFIPYFQEIHKVWVQTQSQLNNTVYLTSMRIKPEARGLEKLIRQNESNTTLETVSRQVSSAGYYAGVDVNFPSTQPEMVETRLKMEKACLYYSFQAMSKQNKQNKTTQKNQKQAKQYFTQNLQTTGARLSR